MFGKRSTPVPPAPPVAVANAHPAVEDTEVASSMACLARAFVAGIAVDGPRLMFDPAEVSLLDALVDDYLADRPDYDRRRGYAFSLGAYLGELLVLGDGGRWVLDRAAGQPGVRLASGRVVLPMEQTARRLEIGVEHSLVGFVQGCRETAVAV